MERLIKSKKKTSKEKLYGYFILCARALIAWVFISYGWSKLTGNQFGLSPEQLSAPVKDLGLFKLSWYLFDQEPFKPFVGISQIIAAILLLYNRTVIIGALISVPILVNILIIDITYLKFPGFYWRLSYYLVLDFLILWYYKESIFSAFKNVFTGMTSKIKYPFWAYLILPIMVIGLDVWIVVPQFVVKLIIDPTGTLEGLGLFIDLLTGFIKQIGSKYLFVIRNL